MDKLTIKPGEILAPEIEEAAALLRLTPEDVCLIAAGQLAGYVLRHGRVTLPMVSLAPETGSALRRAASRNGGTDEWALAETLVASGLEQLEDGKMAVVLPASLILPLRAAFDAANLDGGLEGHIAALLESLIDDLRRGDAESVTGAFIFDPAEEKKEADAAMAAAVRAFEKKEVAA